MGRKLRLVDLALLPFGLCVLFLLLLGKLFGLTYKQISVVFNLWVQGVVLALSGLTPAGVTIYKIWESFSVNRLLLIIFFALYGMVYVYGFIRMLKHYHLPFDYAFDLCVDDLNWVAKKWHTTYQMVNIVIFVILYLLFLGLNLYLGFVLLYF